MNTREKKKMAIKIICAMTYEEGWDSNPIRVKKVQKEARILQDDSIKSQRPLPKMDFDRFTPGNFLYLYSLGYLVQDIRDHLDTTKAKFTLWLKKNRVTTKYRIQMNLDTMDFSEEDMRLPIRK